MSILTPSPSQGNPPRQYPAPGADGLPIPIEVRLPTYTRRDVERGIDFWLRQLHVAQRTNDPDGANHAETMYDLFYDELDRRDEKRRLKEEKKQAKLEAAARQWYADKAAAR